jgi:hypothetical protein
MLVVPTATAFATTPPTTKVLLKAQGSGPKITPKFTVTGKHWDLAWSYKCTGPTGMFVVSAKSGRANTVLVNKTGSKGSGIFHSSTRGTFSLIVFTGVCAWTLKATG